MYQHRHYPYWDGDSMWMGNPIVDSEKNIRGLTVLHAVTEGHGMAEWYGLIKASVYVVNPLGLQYPDNTHSGKKDFVIPSFLPQSQQQAMFNHMVNTTKYNPALMAAYVNGVHNTCTLLGAHPQRIHNYWLAGFGILDMYQEGETGAQCWNRLREEFGVLDFLVESVANGELQEGLMNNIAREQVELPETRKTYTPQMKNALKAQIYSLKNEWGVNMRLGIDRICEEGLIHECKRDSETSPQKRGKLTPKELYLPRVADWLGTTPEAIMTGQTQPVVNQRSADNYRKLVEVFKGDGYSIEPNVNKYGDIVLQWRHGPDKIGEAILSGDGAMHLDIDYVSRDTIRSAKFVEMQAQIEFNEDLLSTFIETGNLPN